MKTAISLNVTWRTLWRKTTEYVKVSFLHLLIQCFPILSGYVSSRIRVILKCTFQQHLLVCSQGQGNVSFWYDLNFGLPFKQGSSPDFDEIFNHPSALCCQCHSPFNCLDFVSVSISSLFVCLFVFSPSLQVERPIVLRWWSLEGKWRWLLLQQLYFASQAWVLCFQR